jgi:hypothetical protein
VTHTKWHSQYTSLLNDRGYYDIFMMDMDGNVIYSVHKNKDFADNFKAGGGGKCGTTDTRACQDSGLARAWTQTLDDSDIHYENWALYAPLQKETTDGARRLKEGEAAFFATAIFNESDDQIGTYVIMLPSSYEQSVDKEYEETCSLQALTASFEGALNVGGMGRPKEKYMDDELECFLNQNSRSVYDELDKVMYCGMGSDGKSLPECKKNVKEEEDGNLSAWHFASVEAYVIKPNEQTGIPPPPGAYALQGDSYPLIRANAVDATCVIARTIRHFLTPVGTLSPERDSNDQFYQGPGFTIDQIKRPVQEQFETIRDWMRAHDFHQGVTGKVKFNGNDKPNNLLIQQVYDGVNIDVAMIDTEGNVSWINGGPVNTTWQKEEALPPPPPAEKSQIYFVVHIIVRFVLILLPITIGCIGALCNRKDAKAGAGPGAGAASAGGSGGGSGGGDSGHAGGDSA